MKQSLFLFMSLVLVASVYAVGLPGGDGIVRDACGYPDYGSAGCLFSPPGSPLQCCARSSSECKSGWQYYYAGFSEPATCTVTNPNQCETFIDGSSGMTWDGLCMPIPSGGSGGGGEVNGTGGTCGDGYCTASELDLDNCPADCGYTCGNGVCDPGEVDVCYSDCGISVSCDEGQIWDEATSTCVASCSLDTQGETCLSGGTVASGFYCSRGQTGTEVAAPGVCCPTTQYWDPTAQGGIGACTDFDPCYDPLAPSAYECNYAIGNNNYFSDAGCFFEASKAACCNTGAITPDGDVYQTLSNTYAEQGVSGSTMTGIAFCASSPAVAPSRTITCSSVADGICPEDFTTLSCAVCDPDCGVVCVENTALLCSDGLDNDGDSQTDYADANPGVAVGQSCNVCSDASCTALGATYVRSQASVANPSDVSITYMNAATLRPGDATNLRMDSDGTSGASSCWCGACNPGYNWDAGTRTCTICGPAPIITSFVATPNPGAAPLTTTLTLTTSGGCGAVTLKIDTNENNATYEVTGGSNPLNAVVPGLAVGSHKFYAQVQDSFAGGARTANASVTVTVTNNPIPVIRNFTYNMTSRWQAADVTFTINVSDNAPNFAINLSFGDGTYFTDNSGPATSYYRQVTKTFTVFSPLTARLNVTDAGASSNVTSFPYTPTPLPCVAGTQTGNVTYDDNASQCCSNSCASEVNYWYSCFAVSACYPNNQSICGGATNPPVFVDRDNDQTSCEASSATCTQYTWSAVKGICCGDDANEQGIENTPALCTDGFDNDCDANTDAMDVDCSATSIQGTVTLLDDKKNPTTEPGVQVFLSGAANPVSTNISGNYIFNSASDLLPGEKTLYASKLGYKVDEKTVTITTDGTYVVDFTLSPRKCNANCMNDQGFCDASCIGVGNCQPTADEITTLNACHPSGAPFGYKPGTEVTLSKDEAAGTRTVGVCCTVPPQERNAPKSNPTTIDNSRIDTLVKYTRTVNYNGEVVEFVIATW